MGLTVGIPVRNAEWCLPHCFESLKAQIIQPDEYIVCVGPSHDRTEKLAKEFQEYIGVPTQIIYDEEGAGIGYARKVMVEEATQEYVCWIDSDEIYPSNWVEAILLLIDEYNFEVLQACRKNWTEITLDDFLRMGKKLPKDVNTSSLSVVWGPMRHVRVFNRELFLRIGNYDPFFTFGQDTDIHIRLGALNIKGLVCKELHFLHMGLVGQYSKMFDRAQFFKFLYKYGFGYMLLNFERREHVIAFLLRSVVFFSLLSTLICLLINIPIVFPLLGFFSSFFMLCVGLTKKHGFKPSLYIIQLGKCLGEYYRLYEIIRFKNRKRFGYGKELISGGVNE